MALSTYILSLALSVPPLLYIALGLAVLWYFITWSGGHHDNLPPCPVRPYPIVGHLPYLRSKEKTTLQTLHEWSQKTNGIFTMYLGRELTIFINSYDIMKEAFIRKGDFFSDRPMGFFSKQKVKTGGRAGIIDNNGDPWKEQRSVSMQILRTFGMGKNMMEEKISEEVDVYLENLSNLKGEASDVRLVTNTAVSNVICAILVGQRFDLDDPNFNYLIKVLNDQVKLVPGTGMLNAFPFLRYLPGDYFNFKRIIQNAEDLIKLFSEKFIKEKKETGDSENFVGSYFSEMSRRQTSGKHTHLDERNLVYVMSNLFAAGSETTSTTILWALLFAILYPEEQDKFHKELMSVVGSSRRPSMADKPQLNFVNAFIMETQRLGSIAPLSLPHTCTQTTELAGYTIPKGARVTPHLQEVLHDANTWSDPMTFKPQRFLDEDNNLVVPEQFIPFSIGRRYCMGESLAKAELFLFLTAVFQRFHLKPEDTKNLPKPVPDFGLTCVPTAYKIRLVERSHEDEE